MLTSILLLATMQTSGFTAFREPPPTPRATRTDFKIGGGYVLECSYTWSDWSPDGESGLEYCNHEGSKKVHVSHIACTDGTCHVECTRPHNFYGHDYDAVVEMDPGFAPSMRKWAVELERSKSILSYLFQGEVSMSPVIADLRDQIESLRKDRQYSPYLGEHFANSCEGVDRNLKYVMSTCTLSYRLRAATLGTIYVEDSFPVATLKTVGQGLIRRKLYCKCDPALNPPKPVREVSLLPGSNQEPVSQGYAGIWEDKDGDGEYVQLALSNISKYKIEFHSSSMTSYQVSCASGPNAPASLIVVPGFTLDSRDSKVQDLLVCGGVKLSPREGVATGKGRAACLEMKKSEPTIKTPYRAIETTRPELIALAFHQSQERIAGPWDQVRVWMFTEGATYAEIKKVLQPMVTPSRFVREIEAMGRLAIPANNPSLKTAFDPEFVKAESLTSAECAIYAQKAWIADESRCLSWIKQQPSVSGQGFAAFVAEGMFRNPAKTLPLIAEKLAKLKKDEFARQQGWDLVGQALFRSDAKTAEMVLKLMESAPNRAQYWYLINTNPALPQELQSCAEKLAKIVEPKPDSRVRM